VDSLEPIQRRKEHPRRENTESMKVKEKLKIIKEKSNKFSLNEERKSRLKSRRDIEVAIDQEFRIQEEDTDESERHPRYYYRGRGGRGRGEQRDEVESEEM